MQLLSVMMFQHLIDETVKNLEETRDRVLVGGREEVTMMAAVTAPGS